MDNAIKAADERQAYITQDEEARRTYWSRRKAEHDRISGLNYARSEGRTEGQETEKVNIARNALVKGLPKDAIHEITGLDLEVIQQIAKQLDDDRHR